MGPVAHLIVPAFWGFCGAFIYAAPRWVIGLVSTGDGKTHAGIASLELLVSLAVGAAAASAFGPLAAASALTALHFRDDNAVCAVIGLFANRAAPMLVDKGSNALTSGVETAARVLKALRGVP